MELNTDAGLEVYLASDVIIDQNALISNHSYGLMLNTEVVGSRISSNEITGNWREGIWADLCLGNLLYGNSLRFNNGEGSQAVDGGSLTWDNGYPAGGNYWTTFDNISEGCADRFAGPSQTDPGPDGICDAPYMRDGVVDRYPLVEPPP